MEARAGNRRINVSCDSDGIACLYARQCGDRRGYFMLLPRGGGSWSCYWENTDGKRFDCAGDRSFRVPPELDRWCAN